MIFFYILASMATFSDPPILSRFMPELAFKALGALCFIYAAFHLSSRGTAPRFSHSWQSRLFLLLYLVALFSCLTGGRFLMFFVYTDVALLLFVTICVVDSLARLSWVLFSAVAGIAYGSVHLIFEWVQFHNSYSGYRASWSVGDGNYFATSAVLCFPFMFLMVLHCKKQWKKFFYGGSLALSLLGVNLCASRGGFLGFLAAFLFLVARSRHRARNLILISVVVFPLTVLLPISPFYRLLHPNSGDDLAAQARILAWKAGARMIASHPLVGVGLGNFKPLMPQYADRGTRTDTIAHNTYVEVAAELGLPALVIFLGIPVFSYRSLERARKHARAAGREFPYYAALGLQAGLVGYIVGAFFLSAEYQKLFWLVIMLSICLPQLIRPRGTRRSVLPAPSVAADLSFCGGQSWLKEPRERDIDHDGSG